MQEDRDQDPNNPCYEPELTDRQIKFEREYDRDDYYEETLDED